MSVATRIRYGNNATIAAGTLTGTRTWTLTIAGFTAYPDAHFVPGATFTVQVNQVISGTLAGQQHCRVAIVEDKTDTNGQYVGGATPGVVEDVYMGVAAVNGNTSYSAQMTAPSKPGCYRLVLCLGDNATTAQRINSVDQGISSTNFHFDSDGNDRAGGANSVNPTAADRWSGSVHSLVDCTVLAVSDNQGYKDDPNYTVLGQLSAAGATQTQSFAPNGGSLQTFTAPTDSLIVELGGAKGGRSNVEPSGLGGKIVGTLTTTPGETLYIAVGEKGDDADQVTNALGGWEEGGDGGTGTPKGGGGGGASDIRRGGNALTNRKLVAGGAGGRAGGNPPAARNPDGGGSLSNENSQARQGSDSGGGFIGGGGGGWWGGDAGFATGLGDQGNDGFGGSNMAHSTEVTGVVSTKGGNPGDAYAKLTWQTAGSGVLNPKKLRLSVVDNTSGAGGAFGVNLSDLVPVNADGSFSWTYPLDTTFPADPTAVYFFITLDGNVADHRPDLYGAGQTVSGLVLSAQSWTKFNVAAAPLVKNSISVVRTGNAVQVGSGIHLFQDIGLATPGVDVFNETDRANRNRLFNRRLATAVDGPHGRSYFRAYLANAFNLPIENADVTLETLDSDGTLEGSVSLTSGQNGLLEWDQQWQDAHKAFSAFRRSGADDPDNLGAHHIAVASADIHKPAGSKTGTCPDPLTPTETLDFDAATVPGRAKDVRVTGNELGSNEPTALAEDVCGVASELIYAGMVSVNAGDWGITADGAPTGISPRGKPTAAGSFFCKLADRVDESSGQLVDTSAHNPTDRAGRPYYPGSVLLLGRRALFDRGLSGLPDDTGSDLPAQHDQETPLGYSIHSNAAQTFDAVTAPSDATTFGYYQGFSNLDATRQSFGLDSGATENAGFTVDSGLFGYRIQVLAYTIIRDDLVMELAVDPRAPSPGQPVRVKAKAWQVLPDKTRIAKTFDDAPVLYLDAEGGSGAPLTPVTNFVMNPIGALPTGDYEVEFTPDDPPEGMRRSFALIAFGVVSGSKVLADGSYTVGNQNGRIKLLSDIGNGDAAYNGQHLLGGHDIEIIVQALEEDTDTLLAFDDTALNEWIVLRKLGDGSTESWDDTTKAWVAGEPFKMNPLVRSADGKTLSAFIAGADTVSWGVSDVQLLVSGYIDGVEYNDRQARELVGASYQHDRDESENVGIVWSVLSAGDTVRSRRHLREVGDDLQLLIVPRTAAGPDSSVGKIEVAMRRVRNGAASQDLTDMTAGPWIDVGDGAHPNGGDLIFEELSLLPSGAAVVTIPESTLDFAGQEVPWVIAFARVTYNLGEPEERATVTDLQIRVYPDVNHHDEYEIDGMQFLESGELGNR